MVPAATLAPWLLSLGRRTGIRGSERIALELGRATSTPFLEVSVGGCVFPSSNATGVSTPLIFFHVNSFRLRFLTAAEIKSTCSLSNRDGRRPGKRVLSGVVCSLCGVVAFSSATSYSVALLDDMLWDLSTAGANFHYLVFFGFGSARAGDEVRDVVPVLPVTQCNSSIIF